MRARIGRPLDAARTGGIALLAAASVLAGCDREPSLPPEPSSDGPRTAPIAMSAEVLPGTAEIVPLLVRTLEANRREFAGQVGTVVGFGAGEAYPQVWLRDSSTLVPFARYVYPREAVVSWLEEHLSHQRRSGELFDWIAAGRSDAFVENAPHCVQVYRAGDMVLTADKNTSAADQESSAVRSAYLYVVATGDVDWLERRVVGRTVLERLDAALSFLFKERFDSRLGLVANAFTADWGDVNPVKPHPYAVYLDESTPEVAGVYVNAVARRAALELAWLHERSGDPERAAAWRTRADELRVAVRRHLWKPGRGFFRMHIPSRGVQPDVDDSDFFALGGNALAVLAGLAEPAEAASIFATAERRRKDYAMPSIAGVLLPPYPQGTFRHPWLAEEYFYQNGGQWDWWAGPYVLAEFEEGHARTALAHLAQLVGRIRDAGGLYEWWTRANEGEGSAMYAGSAAAIGQALVEGAFGVGLRHEALDIRSRVCDASASIELEEPTTGTRVGYSCEPTPSGVKIAFETEAAAPGRLCVLLPADRDPLGARLGETSVRVTTQTSGLDRYACVSTEWGRGELSIDFQPAP